MKKFEVNEFNYNGFSGNSNEDVVMPYTAEFIEWTPDPGVGRFDCSDGKQRLIPTFALVGGCTKEDFEPQEKTGVMFGSACAS